MSKFATEVDWNDPEAAKEKRQSDFMRLKEGENVVRVMSNPMKTFVHWVTTSDGSQRKINSPAGSPELVKQLEEAGYKLQTNYIIKVLDRGDDKFKLLEVGPQIFKGIQMLNLNPKWGKVTAYDISITKGPKGTQPLYNVTPNPKEKLDASLSAGFEDFNDRVDLTKITATLPDSEINKMLGWSSQKKSSGSQKQQPSGGGSSEKNFDFDFDE